PPRSHLRARRGRSRWPERASPKYPSRRGLLRRRELHFDEGALPFAAREPKLAMREPYDSIGDGQSETGPAPERRFACGLHELDARPLHEARPHSLPRVLHGENSSTPPLGGPHGERDLPLRGELQCVREEVDQDLTNLRP